MAIGFTTFGEKIQFLFEIPWIKTSLCVVCYYIEVGSNVINKFSAKYELYNSQQSSIASFHPLTHNVVENKTYLQYIVTLRV